MERGWFAASDTIADRRGNSLPIATPDLPRTLGALRQSSFPETRLGQRSVKDELRNNLICRIQRGEELFPGIVGYEDTVVPQMVNAILSRHNFILLGLRGQAKTRLIRMLTTLLDEWTPYVEGCEIHDNPYRPVCSRCRAVIAEQDAATPIAWQKMSMPRYIKSWKSTVPGRTMRHGSMSASYRKSIGITGMCIRTTRPTGV